MNILDYLYPKTPMPAPRISTGPALDLSNLYKGEVSVSSDMQDYAGKANKYLSRYKGLPITGEMLAQGAEHAASKFGKVVPVELALAQAQLEGFFGTKGRAARTNNPFNVGNVDDGTNENHSSMQEGINRYYDLMASSYLKNKTADELLENFTNSKGNRYATDTQYESSLKRIIKQINASLYAK